MHTESSFSKFLQKDNIIGSKLRYSIIGRSTTTAT